MLELGAADEGDVEETADEFQETPLDSEDEGDGGRRLWRFRSGSPVIEPDLLVMIDTLDVMLKLTRKNTDLMP